MKLSAGDTIKKMLSINLEIVVFLKIAFISSEPASAANHLLTEHGTAVSHLDEMQLPNVVPLCYIDLPVILCKLSQFCGVKIITFRQILILFLHVFA